MDKVRAAAFGGKVEETQQPNKFWDKKKLTNIDDKKKTKEKKEKKNDDFGIIELKKFPMFRTFIGTKYTI